MNKWAALSEVYNMPDVPEQAKGIIGDVMLDLEEQEQCEDCISRRAAIDALDQNPHYYEGKDCVEQNYDDRLTIAQLPSVTLSNANLMPTCNELTTNLRLTCNCEDAISRQESIDAVLNMADQTRTITTDAAKYALKKLPCITQNLPEDRCSECDAWNQYKNKQQCEDAVSRRASIETVRTMHDRCDTGNIEDYRDLMIEGLSALTPVLPKLPECDDAVDRAEAQTALQFAARRYTISHEAHGEGQVVWSDNLISVPDAMNALRELSSVVPKQKVGKWVDRIVDYRLLYFCSECGERGSDEWKFCPNCGAEMEGGEQDG